ncbi:MAG: PD40 domain-containing protein [Bacteroidales bacterium]|nr:PD40 domain-containing protein [Bacteroidales bacterium]
MHAQSAEALEEMRRGDSLREKYMFDDASIAYVSASEMLVDSLMTADDSLLALDISDRLLMAENGLSMMDFVYVPDVVARHRFAIEDFFLYYPLADSSWRMVPCQLDSAGHAYSKAVYLPEGNDVIYWSATDKDGIRNILHSEWQDTVWSAPALLNEHMTSASDEIYPMLSPDGSKMYFSSVGLYGVGGYDIYVSERDSDTGDWSMPVNMGFPYSSPADDFLFMNTPDGEYSLFASNRDCSNDSVWVYVIKYDDMPVRRAVNDSEELRSIASLDPDSMSSEDRDTDVKADIPENFDTRRYMEKMSEVRALRDSIDRLGLAVEDARIANDEDAVLDGEFAITALRDSLALASKILQDIEMEFLFSGVVIDPDKLMAEADREITGQNVDYVFTRKAFGEPLFLNMLEPEPEFDYSFKILEQGQFAEDNTLPSGLVYQIQMYSSAIQATVSKLNGLSPVFETKSSGGRYTYRVGLFRTYADVLANLNSVKRAGFRNAFIVAFNDGKELTVAKARALEAEKKKSAFYEVRIETGTEDLDAAVAGGVRQQAPGKDIARVEKEDGTKVYIVGPFADKETAENLAGFIRAMGTAGASCVEIPKE